MEELKLTCLHDKHTALGAKMSPFGGFDMPIEYSSIKEEHNAVRNACGVFDVSHMGEIFVSGPDAEKFASSSSKTWASLSRVKGIGGFGAKIFVLRPEGVQTYVEREKTEIENDSNLMEKFLGSS